MRRLLGLLISGLLIVGGLIGCTCSTMEVEVGPLSITPGDIVAGEAFTVEADVTNIGENDGNFTATLRLDDGVFGKKKVWVAAGATETVLFDCIAETPGIHSLKLGGSTATFTALKPVAFEVTFLSIPTEVFMREAIVIEAKVINTGEVEGIYNGRLMVNGTEKASKDTMLVPGATETISFTVTIDTPGTYIISLDGATATLTVILNFPDSNLEAAIRETINKPEGPIYISDLEPITALTAQERNISDLTGLEYCVNLQSLDLGYNNISAISPLAGLVKLETLGLLGSSISDLSPLTGLTNLKELRIESRDIRDYTPLVNLINLETLELGWMELYSDLSPITSITSLKTLVLGSGGDFNIPPLVGLVNLETLIINYPNLSDISVLAGLTNLRELVLWGNNISDISPLAGLTNLGALDLGGNNISDISPLAGLTNLQELNLRQNNISDLSLLASLTNLQGLDLENNNISDISPLAGLTNLRELILQGNNISDISPLAENSGLSTGDTVDLSKNPLSNTSLNVYIPQLEARGVIVIY